MKANEISICVKDECKLVLKYPNTNVSVACDEDCYFKKINKNMYDKE